MKVAKEFIFHAAHLDPSAPAGDQCGRLHGHTYKLRVTVDSKNLDERGMVMHGDALKEIYRAVIEPYVEHNYLNESLGIDATMEAVAEWIHRQFLGYGFQRNWFGAGTGKKLTVRLWETPTMWAEVSE